MKNLLNIAVTLFVLTVGSLNAQNNVHVSVVTEDGQSSLQWTTSKETNSSYFLVESSKDGIHYAPAGQVKAAGYSLSSKEYVFNAENKDGFYRVTLVGMDGGRNALATVNTFGNNEQNTQLAGK